MLTSISQSGRVACVSAALMLTCATILPAYAQEMSAEQLDVLIERLRPADSANVEGMISEQNGKIDQLSRDLLAIMGRQNERLSALEAQLAVLMQMQLQVVAGVGQIEVMRSEASRAKDSLDAAVDAVPQEEQELAASVAAFKALLESVPTTADGLQSLTPEQIKEVETKTRAAKSRADEALDAYVENVLIKKLTEDCSNATPEEQRRIVTAARNGSTSEELERLGTEFQCTISPELIRQLAAARDAEAAQAAFQQAMTSLMMMAIMSGNPYVAAIAAAIMLIMALFADENGDGDGDGQDDEPGSGEEPSPLPAPTPSPVPEPQPGPPVEPIEPVTPQPNTTSIDGLPYKPGRGCLPIIDGPVLTLSPEDGIGVLAPFEVDISKVDAPEDFPSSWGTGEIVLHNCDFGEQSVQIVWTVVPREPTCSTIAPLERPGEGGVTLGLFDGSYAETSDNCAAGQ